VKFGADAVYYAASLAQKKILSSLKLLERTIQLALVAGQEQYTFPVQTVASKSTTIPITLGIPGHPFNTNDQVLIAGVDAEANGSRIVTKIDANFISLNSTVGTLAYVSGGTVYHSINSLFEILRDGVRVTKDSAGADVVGPTLNKKSLALIELNRSDFTTLTPPNPPTAGNLVNFYELATDPLTVGFQGVPGSAAVVKVTGFRRPLSFEDISSTVDPLVPSLHDIVLFIGTRAYMYYLHEDSNVRKAGEKELESFGQELMGTQKVRLDAKRVQAVGEATMKWW
jgi:hypothetical protein